MWDVICLLATAAFFLLAVEYTRACRRLGKVKAGNR